MSKTSSPSFEKFADVEHFLYSSDLGDSYEFIKIFRCLISIARLLVLFLVLRLGCRALNLRRLDFLITHFHLMHAIFFVSSLMVGRSSYTPLQEMCIKSNSLMFSFYSCWSPRTRTAFLFSTKLSDLSGQSFHAQSLLASITRSPRSQTS